LIIPNECVPFIRWQRSRLIKSKFPDDADVKRRYAEWVAEDFAGMEPYLPQSVASIIEIGCGMAGIEVFLKRKFPSAELSLLDGTGENIRLEGTPNETGIGGWNEKLLPYNSREYTEALLAANGVSVDRWIDIGTTQRLEADLILSLASWGYHYPLSTYSVRGFVIADLRHGKEKSRGAVIYKAPKYDRCAWRQQ
jgi:hypothetical protein